MSTSTNNTTATATKLGFVVLDEKNDGFITIDGKRYFVTVRQGAQDGKTFVNVYQAFDKKEEESETIKITATAKQIKFAKSLAKSKGVALPTEMTFEAYKAFITESIKLPDVKVKLADTDTPTEGQMKLAKSLASSLAVELPELTNQVAVREFITNCKALQAKHSVAA